MAESYQNHRNWSTSIFNNVILKENWAYLRDFLSQLELNYALVKDVVTKYLQLKNSNTQSIEKIKDYKSSVIKIIFYVKDAKNLYDLYNQLGEYEMANRLLQEENGAYLRDLKMNDLLS